MTAVNATQRPLTAEQRESVRRAASIARQRARLLVRQCVELVADADRRRMDAMTVVTEAAKLKSALSASVGDYGRSLRALGASPETVVAVAKEFADDAVAASGFPRLRGLPVVRQIRDDVVRWTTEAYYAGESATSPMV